MKIYHILGTVIVAEANGKDIQLMAVFYDRVAQMSVSGAITEGRALPKTARNFQPRDQMGWNMADFHQSLYQQSEQIYTT